MPSDPQKVQAIFMDAVQKSESERAEFLERECGGDSELRRRVDALIAAHDQSGSFLDSPPKDLAGTSPTIAHSMPEQAGSLIGPFKLLQQIGEGGMGAVYMAEQIEPVERRVALKIIKPGMDTKTVIARFEAERQALAMMDHPNIAKVLDVGMTKSGRPYFVMELVRGVPITQYCDEHQLTPRQRLKLFLPVCQAVQHAHQKGIIHRDIKPSNVLVAEYDDQPVPKIIDFGLAKAMEKRLTAKTMFTEFGQVVGTPEYMSPEQAKLNQMDIDTRSDIYSLGVLLYELLSGNTPFDRQRLRSAAFDELLRIIREEEPPKPSQRLSTVETLPSIAANRHITPAELTRQLSGELDWIVMKTLEKDRSRRYETANGLAADLRRYLNDDPVLACPPSSAYKFRKFARRNKGPLTAATTVSVALMLLAVGSLFAAGRFRSLARHNAELASQKQFALSGETDARRAAEQQTQVAQEALKFADRQRQRAEENLEKAHQTVRDYLTIVSESEELTIPALQTLRGQLLGSALGYYEQFLAQKTDDPLLQLEMAATYMRVAQIFYYTDRLDDAIAALVSGLDILDKLRQQHPDVARCPTIISEFWKGSQSVKVDITAPVDSQAAMAALRRAINLWEEFVAECPTNAGFRADLAVFRMHYVELTDGNLSQSAIETLQRDAERAVALLNQLVIENPKAQQYRADLARACTKLASLAKRSNDGGQAAVLMDRALALHESLVEEFPKTLSYRIALADSLSMAAGRHQEAGQVVQAEAEYRRASELVRGVTDDFPKVQIYSETLSNSLCSLAMLLHKQGKKEEAAKQLQTAIEVWDTLIAKTSIQAAGSESFFQVQVALAQTGHHAESIRMYRKYVKGLADSVTTHPTIPEHRRRLFHAQRVLGFKIWNGMGKPDDAVEPFKAAQATIEELVADFPDDPTYPHWVPGNLMATASLAGDRGRPEEAEQLFQDALKISARLTTEHPKNDEYANSYSQILSRFAEHLIRQGRAAKVTQMLQEQADLNHTTTLALEKKLHSKIRLAFYLATDRPEKAEAELEQRWAEATSGDAQISRGRFNADVGDFLKELGRYSEACQSYLAALEIDPSLGSARLRLGHCHQLLGDHDAALSHYLASRNIQTTDADFFFERGQRFLELQENRHALNDFEQGLELLPYTHMNKRAAEAHFRLGEYQQALEDLAVRVNARPSDTSTIVWIPPALVAQCPDESFKSGMISLADHLVEISDQKGGALVARSQLLLALGDSERALQGLEQATEHFAQAEPSFDECYQRYSAAMLCLQLGEFEKYREALHAMQQRFAKTEDPKVQNFVAWTACLDPDAVEDYSTVLELAEQAVTTDPENDQYQKTLAATQFRAGEYDAAHELLLKIAQRDENPDAKANSSPAYGWYFLAMTQQALGNTEEAKTFLAKAKDWTNTILSDEENPPAWNRRLTLELVRDEATQVITPAVDNQPIGDEAKSENK